MLDKNADYELALIGAALQEPERVVPLIRARGIMPDSLGRPKHRAILAAMLSLNERKRPMDAVTVAGESGVELFEVTSILGADGVIWTSAPHYADQVKQRQSQKRLMSMGMDIMRACQDGECPADVYRDAIAGFQAEYTDLTSMEVDQYPAIRLADLEAYTEPPGSKLVGDGWLRRGAGCLLTGSTGIGKSILCQQVGISVAAGKRILGCIRVDKPYRVMYVQAENDMDTMKRDVLSITKHIEADPKLVQENFVMYHVYGLCGVPFLRWLDLATAKAKPDLLVIDPYLVFVSSGADPNAANTFREFITPVERMINERKCALLLCTHTPKPRDRETWTARESVYMAAGNSAISNWARTSAELTSANDELDKFRLRFGKNCERVGLIDDNQRIIRDLFIEHSGNPAAPHWRISDSQDPPTKSGFKEQVERIARERPTASKKEIAQELGCSQATVSKFYPGEPRQYRLAGVDRD